MHSHGKTFCFIPFIITCLFISIQSLSQSSCNCPAYYQLKTEYENNEAGIKGFFDKLNASSSLICKAKAFEWMASDYLQNDNYDSAVIFFQKAETLYRQTNCGDSVLLTTYKL